MLPLGHGAMTIRMRLIRSASSYSNLSSRLFSDTDIEGKHDETNYEDHPNYILSYPILFHKFC
jgi:hypothetical protein